MTHDETLAARMISARAERQQREIETIKERSIPVRLSDADVERLADRAARAGMTVGELLASFVGDLVDGTYTNGSDERMYAQDWFDRCGFSHYPVNNVAKLACDDALDVFMDHWDNYQTSLEELAVRKENLGDGDITEEDVAEVEGWVSTELKELQAVMKQAECEGTLEEVAAEVTAWYAGVKKLKV